MLEIVDSDKSSLHQGSPEPDDEPDYVEFEEEPVAGDDDDYAHAYSDNY